MVRLALVPVFIAVFFSDLTHNRVIALTIFCLASLTDMLDGYLARKLNQISDFGKLFDPLADKLMVLSALICQGIAGVFPWSAIFIVLGKEILIVVGGAFMLNRGIVVSANYYGKTATVFFMGSLILSFLRDQLPVIGGHPLDLILLWVSVALAMLALCVYAVQAWKKIKGTKAI